MDGGNSKEDRGSGDGESAGEENDEEENATSEKEDKDGFAQKEEADSSWSTPNISKDTCESKTSWNPRGPVPKVILIMC